MAGHMLCSSGSQQLQGAVRAEPYCILNVQVETQGPKDVKMPHKNTRTHNPAARSQT